MGGSRLRRSDQRGRYSVFAEDAEDPSLDRDLGGGDHDRIHLGVGGLEADDGAFAVIALEGGFRTADEGDDDLARAGRAGALDEDEVAVEDVLVAHGLAADLEGEDVAIADDVGQGDGLGNLDGFDGIAGGDASGEGEAIDTAAFGAGRQNIERAAAIVRAGEQALVLQVGDVLVDGGDGAEIEAAGDFFERRGIAVSLDES